MSTETTEKPLEFKRQTVAVQLYCEVAGNSGLGYYNYYDPDGDEYFSIIHVASGYRIDDDLGDGVAAESSIHSIIAMDPNFDWTRSLDEVKADTRYQAMEQGIKLLLHPMDYKSIYDL